MATLGELGEFEAIARLARTRGGKARGVTAGAGDDAAVLQPAEGRELVVTTDAFVEHRHYDPAWIAPGVAGARLAVANLSDMAAMGAAPLWALHSLGARPEQRIEDLVSFEEGLADALGSFGAAIVGGNLTSVDGPAWSSLTLMGEVIAGRAWARSGASAGDLIAVTGHPGRAGAGLRLARHLGDGARDDMWRELIDAWCSPRSRLGFALALARAGVVTAAIDVSDGLAGDLAHVCAASGVGAEIDLANLPDDPLLERAAATLGTTSENLRFGPSDDYELLLAIPPGVREACAEAAKVEALPVHVIGRFADAAHGCTIVRAGGVREPLGDAGFDHFAPRDPRR